ncbi:MAG TPA: response regulator [Anaerolineae bacterium]|nr:response regulator [Anaerolineae bacterium]MCB0179103.1 response regulator [Anaerolineae bacterium]MCB0222940.1 response regulator [Anaerolineae bacterium]MCB9108054.1 response regulator [Anaerolineales bacterium]HRV92181.1 response regulator [Anaerolineae bacterium]
MKKRILYVDDNPQNRLLVKRILHSQGHELLEAIDGESGWNMALRESPDFIFVDLLLPDIDGFELTRQIKASPELSHIPVVTLTAYGNAEIEQIAKEAGFDGFLHKPPDRLQIQAILARFLSVNVVGIVLLEVTQHLTSRILN